MRKFALDQNFPDPIVESLKEYILEAELVSVRKIDERLVEVDDWELLLALHNDSRGWDGLITNDAAMLKLPREMCVLAKTHLKLVVVEAAGHDPLKATGLVLAHLPQICMRLDPERAEVWALRIGSKNPVTPISFVSNLARRENQSAEQFLKKHGLTDAEMVRSPLDRKPRA